MITFQISYVFKWIRSISYVHKTIVDTFNCTSILVKTSGVQIQCATRSPEQHNRMKYLEKKKATQEKLILHYLKVM